MTLHRYFVIVIIAILSDSLTIAEELTPCETGNSAEFVHHPFGFANKSEIKLNCSENGEIQIGRFQVQNITERSILIKLPSECNISIDSISELFGKNYRPTLRNSLLLNCTERPIPCGVIANFDQNQPQNCGFNSSNLSCFTEPKQNGFMPALDKCQSLLYSVFVNSSSESISEIEFGVIELEWWLSPLASGGCAKNANPTDITNSTGLLGFRCQCTKGYEGNAYAGVGHGCRKVSHKCNPKTFITGRCGGGRFTFLIAGVFVGAFLMAGLTLICYCIRRRSMCLKGQMSAKRLLSEAAGNSSVTLYPYKEIERATNGFSEKQRLGTGAFGTVYAGRLHEDEWVAVKKIKYRDHNSIDQVMNEIKLLSSVSHPNLVRLLGCCIEEGQQILVYEFMPNGTLSQHLQRERGNGLRWTTRLTIAAETSNAIAYLHSAVHPPIYHRDIKSSNILLDHGFKSKVADFGLSRLGMTEISHVSTAPQGTPGYVDPQIGSFFHFPLFSKILFLLPDLTHARSPYAPSSLFIKTPTLFPCVPPPSSSSTSSSSSAAVADPLSIRSRLEDSKIDWFYLPLVREKLFRCILVVGEAVPISYSMAELTQPDVYSLRTLQVWKTLLNWLAFFFQIFVQILRAFGHLRLLSSSDSDSSSPSFKPLPVVELPDHEFLAASAVDIASVEDEEESDGLMEKLTIVLDLDETLICAYETSTLPAVVRNQAIEAGLKCFELECFSSDKDCEGKPKVNYVTVFERPGLHDFLNQLGSFADLVLFTAGLEGYARPLVDRIDEENRFSLRLYRPSTISTEYRDHVKDLSCLSKDLRRTVIVDNNPFSFLLQPVNGIPCIPFSAGQPHDSQLLDVILPLLKHLSLQNDVRSVLYERFHMPEWFQKHGIPT